MNKAIAKVCPKCGKITWVGIPAERYEEWQMGVNIQDAWPEGTATERETLKTGFCPECQDEIFKEVNEEPETLGETIEQAESADEYTGDDYSEGLGEPDEL